MSSRMVWQADASGRHAGIDAVMLSEEDMQSKLAKPPDIINKRSPDAEASTNGYLADEERYRMWIPPGEVKGNSNAITALLRDGGGGSRHSV